MNKVWATIFTALVVVAVLGLEFGIIALLFKIACMAFGFSFTWMKALGVFAIIYFLAAILK